MDALLAAWPSLSPEGHAAVRAVIADRVLPALQRMSTSDQITLRVSAARMAPRALRGETGAASGQPLPVVRLLERLIADAERPVRRAAAQAAADAANTEHLDDGTALALESVLVSAISSYTDHRVDDVVLAIADRVAEPGEALRSWLEGPDDAGQLALRSAPALAELALDTPTVLRWLAIDALSSQAVARIEAAMEGDDRTDRASLLAAGHLLRHHHDDALRRVRRPQRLLQNLGDLSISARRGAITWARALPIDDDARLAFASALLIDADPTVRLGAVRLAADCSAGRAVGEALFEFALDPDERVATAAATALASPRREDHVSERTVWWATLARSPHADVRAFAAPQAEALDPLTSPTAARRALRLDRIGWLQSIAAALRTAPTDRLLRTLDLAERLGLAPELESALASLAARPDPRVAAKATAMLAPVRSRRADEAIAASLAHHDPRVRASAVEAAAGRASLSHELHALAADDTPRIRANAIRSLMRRADPDLADRALAAMITDPREDHRRSALWVAARSIVSTGNEVASALATRVRHEPDADLRIKSVRCARRALASGPAASAQPKALAS